MMGNRMRRGLGFALLGLLGGLSAAALMGGYADYLSLNSLAAHRMALAHFVAENFTLAAALFMLIYAGAVALSIPGGAVLSIAGGFLFGLWLGTLFVVIAAGTGAVILFLAAKTALGDMLKHRAKGMIEKLREGLDRDAFYYLLFLRLVPIFPFWLVNLAPAILGVSLSVYARATFIGIIPGAFVFVFLGVGLESILKEHQQAQALCQAQNPLADCATPLSINNLLTTDMLIALSLLGVIALMPVIVKRRMKV